MTSATRWGILSAGKISNDYVKALQLLPKEEHEIVAVAARDLSKAKEFAKRYDIKKAYGSYKELAEEKDIDIVYIGCYHPSHLEACKLMLNANKPVLCEKPMGLNLKQVKEIIQLAKTKNVFFAEGFWSRHFPAWKKLKEELESGDIGKIKMMTVNFGADFSSSIEERSAEGASAGAGGAILGLGCYGIMAACYVFNEKPSKIVASGILSKGGMDLAEFITLHYKDGGTAQLNIHAGACMSNEMVISGSKVIIKMPNFWSGSQLIIGDKTYNFPLPDHSEVFNYGRSEGFVYEAQAIRENLLKGDKENSVIPHKDSEMIIEIMDEVRKQIGLKYDVDE